MKIRRRRRRRTGTFQEISSNKGLEDDIKTVTAPVKKPSLSHRSISTQSEDDMFESLFNLRQSASYDVTTNHGIWQKFRGLCRKITVSKQFTFFIMSVILMKMITIRYALSTFQDYSGLQAVETIIGRFISKENISLRKQSTFRDAATCFPAR